MYQRIVSYHTPKGYIFLLGDKTIAEGEWSDGVFFLLDQNDITEHDNGMCALIHLNKRYLPGFYETPVRNNIAEMPSTKINRFKQHPALAGVTKKVMFAK
jgi:hypothetical protein